ncbi:hypothetical protein D3C71_2245800 [compost metagenome]
MSLTLVLFVVVYFALFGTGLGYMMRLVRKGPKTNEGAEIRHAGSGLSATDDTVEGDHRLSPNKKGN